MEVPTEADPAEQVQECPVLRRLGAFQPGSLLSQGAEARVFRVSFLERPAVAKQRFSKRYRHPDLDARLTRQRLQGEARSLLKARKLGVPTPVLYHVDTAAACLYMEFVPGRLVRQRLMEGVEDDGAAIAQEHLLRCLTRVAELAALARKVGRAVAKLHDGGVVHGDLTTSNMIVRDDGELVLIDFGLAYTTTLAEDKAVDLYVLERAISSAHSARGTLFQAILDEYRRVSRHWTPTLQKFAEVRLRGRKRSMVG